MPSEPEFASIPGTPTSGCPSRPPSRRSRSEPLGREHAERVRAPRRGPGTSWPFDEKKTSRSGSSKPTLGDVQLREEKVRDDVERAEARAEMARAGALHRDERVQPAHVGEQREARVGVALGRADAIDPFTLDDASPATAKDGNRRAGREVAATRARSARLQGFSRSGVARELQICGQVSLRRWRRRPRRSR